MISGKRARVRQEDTDVSHEAAAAVTPLPSPSSYLPLVCLVSLLCCDLVTIAHVESGEGLRTTLPYGVRGETSESLRPSVSRIHTHTPHECMQTLVPRTHISQS